MTQPRIAIIGGGPGGLTLARILHLHGIRATVFEGEESGSVRPQGWSLDMHPDTGQYALECARLTTEFQQVARYEDQESRVYDKHGSLLFIDTDVTGKDQPEVDRGHLRQILLGSLPEEVICWDHKLDTVEPQSDGAFEMRFQNGVRERFDLIVGADGAWSRVRSLVSDARPVYSGVMFVELGMSDVDARFPEIASLVGHGLTFALGDSKAIIAHRNANAHVGAYAALRAPQDWMTDADTSPDVMKATLANCFSDWSDSLLQLIRLSDGKMTPRPIQALPVGHCWQYRKGVTLLGDAAHLMSPFGGDGANLAMRDAADLALALANTDDWDTAVRDYETVMFARAEEAATGAGERVDEVFSDDGLSHVVGFMEWQKRGGGDPDGEGHYEGGEHHG